MNKKWFDFKAGAEYLGITVQELYALARNREFEIRDHLVLIPGKKMISKKGLKILINIK